MAYRQLNLVRLSYLETKGKFKMIGMNTNIHANFYNSSYALANAAKCFSPWRVEGWKEEFPVDSAGRLILEPGQEAICWTFYLQTDYPLGDYVVEIDGDGDLFDRWRNPLIPVANKPGRFILRATEHHPWEGLGLLCTRSNPANRLKLKAVWMPGYVDSGKIFRDEYVDSVRKFSTLRYMEDQNTNNNPSGNWAERPKLTDDRWANYDNRFNMPVEALCDLSNRANCNAYFCFPASCTDEYVTEFAKIVKAQLNPNLKAYFELSNETWNWAFHVAHTYQLGRYAPGTDANNGDFYGQTNWTSWRSVEIFKILEQVFAGERQRIITVIGTQANWYDRSTFLLQQAQNFVGPGKKPCDVLAMAPYLGAYPGGPQGPDGYYTGTLPTMDAFLTNLTNHVEGDFLSFVRGTKAVADAFGVKVMCYEAGQGLAPIDGSSTETALADFYVQANHHPRMYDVYTKYLDVWKREVPGGEMCLFNHEGEWGWWGSWAHIEAHNRTLDKAHKMRSTFDWIDRNAGLPVASVSITPSSVVAGQSATILATGSNVTFSASSPPTVAGGTGASISAYTVSSPTSATFSLNPGSAAGALTVTIAGVAKTITVTSSGTNPQIPAPPTMTATPHSETQINLSWTAVEGATSYDHQGRLGGTTGWVGANSSSGQATTDANTRTYSNAGLAPNTTYDYRVRANTPAGPTEFSSVVSATTNSAGVTIPPSPTLTATVVSDSRIDLSWTAVQGATSYEYQGRPVGASGWPIVGSTDANTRSFASSGLIANTSYEYRVRAITAGGPTDFSAVATAKTNAAPTTDLERRVSAVEATLTALQTRVAAIEAELPSFRTVVAAFKDAGRTLNS